MKLSLIHAMYLAGLLAGCASTPTVSPTARNELAPTGKLRVGLILSNQVLVTKDAQTGELQSAWRRNRPATRRDTLHGSEIVSLPFPLV